MVSTVISDRSRSTPFMVINDWRLQVTLHRFPMHGYKKKLEVTLHQLVNPTQCPSLDPAIVDREVWLNAQDGRTVDGVETPDCDDVSTDHKELHCLDAYRVGSVMGSLGEDADKGHARAPLGSSL